LVGLEQRALGRAPATAAAGQAEASRDGRRAATVGKAGCPRPDGL